MCTRVRTFPHTLGAITEHHRGLTAHLMCNIGMGILLIPGCQTTCRLVCAETGGFPRHVRWKEQGEEGCTRYETFFSYIKIQTLQMEGEITTDRLPWGKVERSFLYR